MWNELADHKLIQAPYPTTIVDLNQGSVDQVRQHNIFLRMRKERMDYEIALLLRDEPLPLGVQQ